MALSAKRALLDRALSLLDDRIAAVELAARTAAEAATHEEARAEGDKDMRSTEDSYLARGQAQRVGELVLDRLALRSLQLLDFSDGSPIAASALVTLEDEHTSRRLLLVPRGGGLVVPDGESAVALVTPQSPLGRAILGCGEGDEVGVVIGGRPRDYEIVEVS